MKNRLCYIGMFLLLSILCINSVYAAEFIVTPVVESLNVTKGKEVSIKLNLKASESISECLFKFENDDNIEYVNVSSANGWVVKEKGVDGINLSNSDDGGEAPSSGVNIAELKYKINGDGSVVIKTVQCVSLISETSYKYDDVSLSFTAKEVEDDTTLSSLVVTNGVMSPSNISSEHTGSYMITLTSATFGLSMTATNSSYQDKIVVKDVNGNVISDLSNITFSDPTGQGQMPLSVIVNGKTTYSLLVTYTQSELDNSLSSITINGKELNLIDGQYDYEYTVGKDVTWLEVAATIKDNDNFKFASSTVAPGGFNIDDFVSVVIVVEPKDSSSGAKAVTYTIDVTKEGTDVGSESGSTGGSGDAGSDGNVSKNPVTADIPMVFMGLILVASLVGSIILYRKNLESYK